MWRARSRDEWDRPEAYRREHRPHGSSCSCTELPEQPGSNDQGLPAGINQMPRQLSLVSQSSRCLVIRLSMAAPAFKPYKRMPGNGTMRGPCWRKRDSVMGRRPLLIRRPVRPLALVPYCPTRTAVTKPSSRLFRPPRTSHSTFARSAASPERCGLAARSGPSATSTPQPMAPCLFRAAVRSQSGRGSDPGATLVVLEVLRFQIDAADSVIEGAPQLVPSGEPVQSMRKSTGDLV
jgi:hypothetical protein